MLLRFSAKNYLSLRDAQELSLITSALKDTEESLISCAAAPSGSALPVAVIYGANASGKSNVVNALRSMRSAVLSSHNRGEPEGGVSRVPFALDPACFNMPSAFDIDVVIEGTRYHYGFTASDEEFLSEWLYAFPSGRRQLLFERERGKFSFGRALKGRNKVISELTRPNSLFVSTATQNGHEELKKVSAFFRSFRSDRSVSAEGSLVSIVLAKDDIDHRVIKFLGNIGTG